MKEKGYYECWILPQLGLHTDDDNLKQYQGRPVGNSPQNMPWDTSLDKDLHDAVKYHVAATADFPKEVLKCGLDKKRMMQDGLNPI